MDVGVDEPTRFGGPIARPVKRVDVDGHDFHLPCFNMGIDRLQEGGTVIPMNFDDASNVDNVCYQIRTSDYPRSKNRARINNLFNGVPPWADDEDNKVNVNSLNGTILAHDARAQFYGAFLRPAQFFTTSTDTGPKHRRGIYGNIVTQEVNKKMKRSLPYFECFRSKFALNVLHGIGPSVWPDDERWLPKCFGIEDIGIPANTLLTMDNLPFFYIYRTLTIPELIKLTRGTKRDQGWNMDLVDKCIAWIDKETSALMGTSQPEIWSPEKTAERLKGDGSFYSSDEVPTLNVYDFYFWNDEDGVEGWNRRIILDAWSDPQMGSDGRGTSTRNEKLDFSRNKFLFNPGKRKYASKLSELIAFQFADLSAVAPFRYHSVRSLGFLVYGVCHLQNRMFCRFNEAAFEATLNYLRINSPDDADRALKIDLINRGVIDKSVQFVPQAERWQVNAELIEMAMNENRRIIESNSSGFTQQQGQSQPGDRKTKFQVMAEIQQTTALVQSAFNQAYRYQEEEYREIFRRFARKNSTDIDVREFQANCLRQGVPDRILHNPCCWEIEPTQVMGSGNKTMEMNIAEQLLQMRNLFDPDPQREILRDVTFAVTGDASKAQRWVPDQPLKVTDSVHDAQLAMGSLMQSLPVSIKTGMNHKEYIQTMLQELQAVIQPIEQSKGMATQQQISGFQAVLQHVEQHIQILAQDPEEKQFVAEAQKAVAKLMNFVRAFAQRLQEQQQKAQQQGQGMPPEAQAKIAATQATAQAKIKNSREGNAQKLSQKQIAFEKDQQRKQVEFEQDQARKNLETVAQVHRDALTSMSDGGGDDQQQ